MTHRANPRVNNKPGTYKNKLTDEWQSHNSGLKYTITLPLREWVKMTSWWSGMPKGLAVRQRETHMQILINTPRMSRDDLKNTWNLMLISKLEGKVSMKNSCKRKKNPAEKSCKKIFCKELQIGITFWASQNI